MSLLLNQNITNDKKIAMVFQENTYTYAELKQHVKKTISDLKKIGVKKNDLVGIYFQRSPDMIFAMLALIEIEACFLPIDINSTEDRLNYIIENSHLNLILADEKQFTKISSMLNKKEVSIANFSSLDKCPNLFNITKTNDDAAVVRVTGKSV